MQRVLNLVGSLKESEIRLVKSYYRSHHDYDDISLREKLFMLALSRPDCDDKEAMHFLFKRKNPGAFSLVKQQLKTDVLNILLLQDADMKFKSKYAQAVFNCRRMIIQGEILLGRGVYDEAMEVLDKAWELATHNELYAEQVMIDDIYRTHLVVKEGGKDFTLISDRIRCSIALLDKSSEAKQDHYELIVPGLYRKNHGHHLNGEGQTKLDQMKQDFEATGSLRIGFYYHLSAMHYYREQYDFAKSLDHGLALLQLVRSSPAFQSDSFFGGAKMELAKVLINLGRYDEALEYAQVAYRHFKPGMINQLLALEQLYYCYIRKRDLKNAGEIVDRAFQNKKVTYNGFINAKWWFFKAGLEFLNQDFAKALGSLKNSTALLKDKTGWMLGYTMLEVMCRLESGNIEWCEARMEGLRKIMLRYTSACDENCDARMESMFRLLRSLRAAEYDYAQLQEAEKERLALMAGNEGMYRWDPTGYELVRFEDWLKEKAERGKRKPGRPRKMDV